MLLEFNKNVTVLTLPVMELDASNSKVLVDGKPYKARLSVNDPRIVHGIPKQLQQPSDDGKVYFDGNLTDGCDYIDSTNDMIMQNQTTFVTQELFTSKQENIDRYKELIVNAYKALPSVWSYSCNDNAVDDKESIEIDWIDSPEVTEDWAEKCQNK